MFGLIIYACSGPLPLIFEGAERDFGGKNCQNASGGNLVDCPDMTKAV